MDYLIHIRKTGTAAEFATKVGVARSTFFEYMDYMRNELNIVILYDRSAKTYHSQASGTAVHTVQLFIERKFAHNRFFCFTLRVSRFVSLPQVTHSGIVQSIRISLLGLSVR